MATYTSNYGWTKPSGSDNVDISVLNNNLDDQDSTIHDAFLNMAPPFSESSTYAVDDIVLYGTGLYKCHTAVVTPGSWTGSTNWQVYKLSEGGSGGGGGTSDYNPLTNKPQINGVTLIGNKTTSDLGINADNVMMSDGVTSVEEAVDGLTEALTIGTVVTDGVATLDTWLITDATIESTGLYSVMYVSNAGMRYQLILLGANLSTIQTPIGMTGNINQTNNILLAKEDGTNKLCMYVSSGVGAGAYYVTKLMDLRRPHHDNNRFSSN